MNVVDAILESVDLLDHIPSDVDLRRIGTDRWRGRCLIHNGDSKQSFEVRRHRNGHLIWQCFVCHERGSVIDYVAKVERLSNRQAIERLRAKKWTDPDPQVIVDRHYERHLRGLGKFTLACDVPGCLSLPREVGDDLEAALMRSDGSPWEVAPDGVAAICPRCLARTNRLMLTPYQRLRIAIEYQLIIEQLDREIEEMG